MTKIECSSCRRLIDAAAKLCVYCGADPKTGEKFDTRPIIEEHFPKKKPLPALETLLEMFRSQQGIALAIGIVLIALATLALHRFISVRNETEVTEIPAVPLTEVADLSNRDANEQKPPIPDLDFEYDGEAARLRALIVEPGAIAPPAETLLPNGPQQPVPPAAALAGSAVQGPVVGPQAPMTTQTTPNPSPQAEPSTPTPPPPSRPDVH